MQPPQALKKETVEIAAIREAALKAQSAPDVEIPIV